MFRYMFRVKVRFMVLVRDSVMIHVNGMVEFRFGLGLGLRLIARFGLDFRLGLGFS